MTERVILIALRIDGQFNPGDIDGTLREATEYQIRQLPPATRPDDLGAFLSGLAIPQLPHRAPAKTLEPPNMRAKPEKERRRPNGQIPKAVENKLKTITSIDEKMVVEHIPAKEGRHADVRLNLIETLKNFGTNLEEYRRKRLKEKTERGTPWHYIKMSYLRQQDSRKRVRE